MEETGTFCCWGSPFSSSGLQLPHPPHRVQEVHRWPRLPPVGSAHFQSSAGRSAIGPGGLPSCPAGYLRPRLLSLPTKLILQLLPLAQAASDYLKPQPFIYEKGEPDITLIDCHLLNISWGGGNRNGTLSAWIMELFLDVWAFFTPLSN